MTAPLIEPLTDAVDPESHLEGLRKVLESCPRLLGTAAHSEATLDGLLAQVVASAQSSLSPRMRAAIGLRVAQLNRSGYGLAASTALATKAGIDPDQVTGYRRGLSPEPREQALLALTSKVVLEKGHHAGFAVEMARRTGVTDCEIVEVVAQIALGNFSHYLTAVANTLLDHPAPEDPNLSGSFRSPQTSKDM